MGRNNMNELGLFCTRFLTPFNCYFHFILFLPCFSWYWFFFKKCVLKFLALSTAQCSLKDLKYQYCNAYNNISPVGRSQKCGLLWGDIQLFKHPRTSIILIESLLFSNLSLNMQLKLHSLPQTLWKHFLISLTQFSIVSFCLCVLFSCSAKHTSITLPNKLLLLRYFNYNKFHAVLKDHRTPYHWKKNWLTENNLQFLITLKMY